MTIRWRKEGLLFCPSAAGRHPRLLTHAANPLAIHMHGDVFRIFYSGRDAKKRSSVGAVDIDLVTRQIIEEHHSPVFEYGPPGSFYSAGVSVGNSYSTADGRYVLFMGWQADDGQHWRGDIGRLALDASFRLKLDPNTAFLVSDQTDPISLSYPFVLQLAENSYQMWYGSTLSWDAGNGEMLHVLNHAFSDNGQDWSKTGLSVPFELGVAQAFSRPSVVGSYEHGFHMWFSYRGNAGSYRIGHAVSSNARDWTLALDQETITVSEVGWDSDMIEYPFVFDHQGLRYMLYNGNGYGVTGFGLAVAEL